MGQKEVKEKEKLCKETLGKFFFDLAKANFTTNVAGCILSMVMNSRFDDLHIWELLIFGLLSTSFLAYIGYRILKK